MKLDIKTAREHLLRHYATQDHLQVRIQTHELYSNPKIDFSAFVLDRLTWHGHETVVDTGCGAGAYAAAAAARAALYIAADLSLGMLRSLAAVVPRLNLDVQNLPLQNSSADVVLANHMLYHVPDQRQALREIRRILKPGGALIAATNSATSRRELSAVVSRVMARLGGAYGEIPRMDSRFTLENGGDILETVFADVTRHDLPSAFVFPGPEPVVAYVMSGWDHLRLLLPDDVTPDRFAGALDEELAPLFAGGEPFQVNKLTGVFVCR